MTELWNFKDTLIVATHYRWWLLAAFATGIATGFLIRMLTSRNAGRQ